MRVWLSDQLVLGRQVSVIVEADVMLVRVVDEAPAIVKYRRQHGNGWHDAPEMNTMSE